MKIRIGTIEDTLKISEVHSASIQCLCQNDYDLEKIESWISLLNPTIYEQALLEKILIVAELKNQIVGFGILDFVNSELSAVYVHPSFSRQGVGKEILLNLEVLAVGKGVEELILYSTVNAVKFYEHYGYLEEYKTVFNLRNGTSLSCTKMHKQLKYSARGV
jgi:putative acetyltransferase